MVVPGTPRDSLYILDCLINLDAGPKPELVTTDQASDSDMSGSSRCWATDSRSASPTWATNASGGLSRRMAS
jgi:hypothetical protein